MSISQLKCSQCAHTRSLQTTLSVDGKYRAMTEERRVGKDGGSRKAKRPQPRRPGSVAAAAGCARQLDKAFQQIFQLSHLLFHDERRVGNIVNLHGERAIVLAARELVNDAAIFDFTLADAELEL